MKIKMCFKKIIMFVFRKKIAKLKAKQMEKNMIDSMRIVTSESSNKEGGTIISSSVNKKEHLEQMKNIGIKKVELICIDKCECCKNMFNKKIPIDEAVELPRKDCPLELCRGKYAAVVEFDLS